MDILIEENKRGTLKLTSLVVKKLIYILLTSDNYQVEFADIDASILEDNSIIAEIKLAVACDTDLLSLKSKLNKMILKRVNSVLNSVLLNTHLVFITNNKEEVKK
ncbi:hypothetical protein [Spiroplasma endosymbiont of Virgichneumon dumeticola]|uniref:hypothetical protein n=1 Tax=Spiroplasma endosymbiont of Virgichneumon dumeticola TaxID=3139323 RepID=UPI0035C8B06C